MAYQDEIAAANRLRTMEERFAARNAVRAKYGMDPEKRTRGGAAGVWDRNKGFITTAAEMAAGALGGIGDWRAHPWRGPPGPVWRWL
jgi:hypothetical protein